jgi:hypothetical protein
MPLNIQGDRTLRTASEREDQAMTNPPIRDFLADVTPHLASFLEGALQKLSSDWWRKRVWPCLSEDQQRNAERKRVDSLMALDLAALLRVLDVNWRDISGPCSFGREERNYAMEMKSVRNRLAHSSSAATSFDDQLRDLDTLQRFSAMIDASATYLARVTAAKEGLLRDHAATLMRGTPPSVLPNAVGSAGSPQAKGEATTITADGRDLTQYRFNGQIYGKGRLVLAVVKEYVRRNPGLSYQEVIEAFPDALQRRYGIVRKYSEVGGDEKLLPRYFMKPPDRIPLSHGRDLVVVCNQWGITNMPAFLRHAWSLGYNIEPE